MYKCLCCRETKLLSEFHKDSRSKIGIRTTCKECSLKKSKEWKQNNKDATTLHSIKDRAKNKKVSFDLDTQDIIPPPCCPVFGFPLVRNTRTEFNSPSVDRIDPTKGYVKGNVQVISQLANAMKQDATPEQLLMFADWVYKTYKK
jgi:hypothetical protein